MNRKKGKILKIFPFSFYNKNTGQDATIMPNFL